MSRATTRREFLKTSAVVAGGVAAGLGGNFVARAEDLETIKKTRSYNADMEYRTAMIPVLVARALKAALANAAS